jgi:hypothetical protein
MIAPPPGWTQHFGANLVTLYPPEGGGRIRYHQRCAGRTFRRIVDEVLAKDPLFRVEMVMPPARVISDEGEYGAWVVLRGTRDGTRAMRYVGAIMTDDVCAAVDGIVLVRPRYAALEKATRELLQGVSLGLGVRRRRFLYDPPPGWQALPSGLVANWYPPDFPANATNVAVYPANPVARSPHELFERLLADEQQNGLVVEGAISEEPFRSDHGLAGTWWCVRGHRARPPGPVHREIVIFGDPTYRYSLRLETTIAERIAEHRDLFRAVARSARPIPLPGARQPGFTDLRVLENLSAYWVD